MSVVMNPVGTVTKNDCAGDGQQKFTPTRSELTTPKVARQINMVKNPEGQGTKIYCAGEGQHQCNRNRQSHDAVRDVRDKNTVMGLDPATSNLPGKQAANFSFRLWSWSQYVPEFLPYNMALHLKVSNLNCPSRLFCRCLHSCSWRAFLQVVKFPYAAALIPRNYPSSRTISLQNALVMFYQEVIIVYFTFDLLCAGDRLLLGDGRYVWGSTKRSATDEF
jgi:hypothetical protein